MIDDRIAELELHLRDNRDDLESWAVLGDLWLEKGHPRGEIIALTLKQEEMNPLNQVNLIERIRELENSLSSELSSVRDYINFKYSWGYIDTLFMSYQGGFEEVLRFLEGKESIMLRSLHYRSLTNSYLMKLEASLEGKALRKLDMSGDCSYYEALMISGSNNLKELRTLNLARNNLRRDSLRRLLRGCKLPNLRELDLSDNTLEVSDIEELCESDLDLEYLNLDQNNLWDRGAELIANRFKGLKYLSLEGCLIGTEGAIAISGLKDLEVLNIGSNNIGAEGEQALRALQGCDYYIGSSRFLMPLIFRSAY